MAQRLPSSLPLTRLVFLVLAVAAATLLFAPRSLAFAPAGSDELAVLGEVGVTSLMGSETFTVAGTASVEREDAHLEGPVEVVDMQLVDLALFGVSLIGSITVAESSVLTSSGELRALQAAQSYPASNFIDVYIEATAPANPDPTITLANNVPLRMVPTSGGAEIALDIWPPNGVTFEADTTPCVPLLPTLPMEACITSFSAVLSPFVGGETELAAPEDRRARDQASGITSREGVYIGVAAVALVSIVTTVAWLARRRLLR